MWVSTVNNERKMDIGEYFGKDTSYLFKGLKNSVDSNPIRNGILFLSINRGQHCKLSAKDQLNYVPRSPAEVEMIFSLTWNK